MEDSPDRESAEITHDIYMLCSWATHQYHSRGCQLSSYATDHALRYHVEVDGRTRASLLALRSRARPRVDRLFRRHCRAASRGRAGRFLLLLRGCGQLLHVERSCGKPAAAPQAQWRIMAVARKLRAAQLAAGHLLLQLGAVVSLSASNRKQGS